MVERKVFLVEVNVLIFVEFDLSLMSSFVIFTLNSPGRKDLGPKLRPLISYLPGGNVYPVVVRPI